MASPEGNGPDTIMARHMGTVDSSTLEAIYLASDESDKKVPRHLGHLGRVWEDRAIDIRDILFGERVEDSEKKRVEQWCKDRHVDRGVDGAFFVASFFSVQRPDGVRGFDDDIENQLHAGILALMEVSIDHQCVRRKICSPRALGCTMFEVLS